MSALEHSSGLLDTRRQSVGIERHRKNRRFAQGEDGLPQALPQFGLAVFVELGECQLDSTALGLPLSLDAKGGFACLGAPFGKSAFVGFGDRIRLRVRRARRGGAGQQG